LWKSRTINFSGKVEPFILPEKVEPSGKIEPLTFWKNRTVNIPEKGNQ
jgi:hypothetical protein